MHLWSPPVGLSAQEARFLSRLRNGKLYAFLREVRHEMFDEATQQALMATYTARGSGKTPVPPALLAMVLVLQGALHVSDEEAVERATSDRRWQLVLGTFDDNEEAPFTKSTLYAFRERLIQHNLDVMLFDRVVAWARASKGYSHTALRAAFDSAPLRGAGRVEDTFNLLGHAVREVLRTVSDRSGRSIEDVAHSAGIPLVVGSSLKASLDRDWDDPAQRKQALTTLLAQIDSLGKWLRAECELTLEQPPLAEQWQTVERLIAQDTEPDPEGGGQGGRRIKRGVAAERQISPLCQGSCRLDGRRAEASDRLGDVTQMGQQDEFDAEVSRGLEDEDGAADDGSRAVSASALALKTHIPQSTLSRWLLQFATLRGLNNDKPAPEHAETDATLPDPPGDEARRRLRDTESREVVRAIQAWALKTEALPQSGLRRAIEYMGAHWKGLLRFLDDPRVPLDNNATERALRGPVQGRKNHYGSRSRRGSEVAALFYTLVDSALLNGLDPREYLRTATLAALTGETVPLPHEIVAKAAT